MKKLLERREVITVAMLRNDRSLKYARLTILACLLATVARWQFRALPVPQVGGALDIQFVSTGHSNGWTATSDKMTLRYSMADAFNECSGLTGSIPDLSKMTLCNSMSAAFYGCSGLTGSIPSATFFDEYEPCYAPLVK